jgi:hypothetical protein
LRDNADTPAPDVPDDLVFTSQATGWIGEHVSISDHGAKGRNFRPFQSTSVLPICECDIRRRVISGKRGSGEGAEHHCGKTKPPHF